MDWNKEISLSDLFKRKGAPEEELQGAERAEVEADPQETPTLVELPVAEGIAEPVQKESLLKKEISFRRKPKQPKPPKQRKEKAPKPPGEKKSFLKRKPKDATDGAAPAEPKAKKPKAKKPKGERGRRSLGQRRQKRLVGLKIGGSQLAAARVANNGAPEVLQLAREDLEPGIVVAGELREPELLAESLRAFFKRNRLPKTGVRLGIANNRIGVRIFEIGGVDDPRQLENAIRFRAQEALPIPIEEAVLDYHVLEEKLNEEGMPTRRILLVVAYRELVDRYVTACKKAGVKLVGIDLEAFALLRALSAPPSDGQASPDAAIVVVGVGHDRTTFAVSDGRVCEFTRVLDWGGQSINVALARALDITPSEAEPIKRALSLTPHANPVEGLTEEQDATAREAVRRQLQTFARELVSSLQFYQNQPGSLGIGEIVVTGGTAQLDGLAEELQRLIGVRVRVGDPLARVKVGKKLRELSQIGSLSSAIGLGIED
ncbi:MAG: type IV pilus assembly protein PilM [Gaiellaceae bacterium]